MGRVPLAGVINKFEEGLYPIDVLFMHATYGTPIYLVLGTLDTSTAVHRSMYYTTG